MTPNPFEERARAVKAFKISRVLVRAVRNTDYPADRLPTATQAERDAAARLAEVRSPSERTWDLAVALTNEWLASDSVPA